MKDRSAPSEPPASHHGKPAAAVLRLIDAGIHRLERLRNRIEPPVDKAERGRGDSAAPEAAAEVAKPRRRAGFLGILLIVVVAVLAGAAGGTWTAYRGMARILDKRAAAVESLQEDLAVAQKEQTRSTNQMARFQEENGELHLQLRESQRQNADDQARIDDLEKQLAEAKRTPRAAAGSHPVAAASGHPRSATCAVSTANAGTDLSRCIDGFNR
jgi:uncharacterized protein HemX